MSEQLALIDSAVVQPNIVWTAYYGLNDQLIANVARLYIADGALVLDCTWGKGLFWRRTDTSRFQLLGADLAAPADLQADLRALPVRSSSVDVVTLDPPYVHGTTQPRRIHSTYRNNETTPGMTHAAVIDLYRQGMVEAWRVLRPGGTCWVKCQDAVEGRQQQWTAIRLHAIALELGYSAQDMFVLLSASVPGSRWLERQYHARRNHSYLWIFSKPIRKEGS